jgi:hypothetical protein
MCGFMVTHLDVKKLSAQKRRNLRRELQRRRDVLRDRIKRHQAAVRDINKGLKKL